MMRGDLDEIIAKSWIRNIGTSIIVTGSMKSGKTELLTLTLAHCKVAGHPFVYVTHSFDLERRHEEPREIVFTSSHGKTTYPEHFFTNTADLASLALPERYILGINEVQFADDPILEFIENSVAQRNIIILTGLDKTSEHQPFPLRKPFGQKGEHSGKTMYDVIGLCEEKIILYSPCMYKIRGVPCNNPAYYSHFLGKSKGIIKTGSENYEPRCNIHKDD